MTARCIIRSTRRSKLYVDGALSALRTPELKQLWRNQLLGETLLQRAELRIERFTSLLLYPVGNMHYEKAGIEHARLMTRGSRKPFITSTFEEFIARCRQLAGTDLLATTWLDYLERRYIVAG